MKHALAILACALLLAACSTQRRAPRTPDTEAAPAGSPAAQFAALAGSYGLWHDVQMPVRATLRSPFSLSASGRMTLVRDSLVHISMRVLGMEVGVMQLTRDSVFVVDKFHRFLIAESMGRLTAGTGLTLADVQSALLGRAFVPGRGAATTAMSGLLRLSATPQGLRIAPAEPPQGYTWLMNAATLDDGRTVLTDLTVSVEGREPATAAFTPAARLSPAGAVAEAVDVQAHVAGRTIDARLSYSPAEARWNTGAAPALPSLRGYTRVSPAKLLKGGFL